MRKFIVTTTINSPTEALIKYSKMDGWVLIVVGDKKTPHKEYEKLGCVYLSLREQENWPKLSKLIGWNTIQRRNFGFIRAYEMGAEVVATVDDDNIPGCNWGKDLFNHQAIRYKVKAPVFDPLSVTDYPHLWHRGYPLQLLRERYEFEMDREVKKNFLIQADLWNEDPDIDAICRMMYPDKVRFGIVDYFFSDKPSPFNSQNTFLKRKVLPDYFLFPHIGRMDDIWASYYVQSIYRESVVYGPPTVTQKRNPHSIIKDMQDEMLGYEKSIQFSVKPDLKLLPMESREAFKEYQKIFKKMG